MGHNAIDDSYGGGCSLLKNTAVAHVVNNPVIALLLCTAKVIIFIGEYDAIPILILLTAYARITRLVPVPIFTMRRFLE
jgi:hypothetical protein